MALTSNVSFSGKYSYDFFSAALFDNTILNEFSIYDSQQNSLLIPRVTLAGHTRPDSCGFSATGSITLDPATLTVCKFEINELICRSEVEPTFLSNILKPGSNNEAAPRVFTDYLVSELSGIVGNNMQNLLWNGNTATYSGTYMGLCNGLITQALADATVIDVAATASITTANVEAELARVFLAIPANVKSSGKPYKIYVSQDIADKYAVAQGQLAYSLDSTTKKEMRYAGVPIVVGNYMPAKTMFATSPDNIGIGVDLLGDWSTVKVIDTSETLGENAYRLVARWKFGVVIKMGSEVVLYS